MNPTMHTPTIARWLLIFCGLTATMGFLADQSDDYISTLTLNATPTQVGLLNAIGSLGFFLAIPLAKLVTTFGRTTTCLITYGTIIVGTLTNFTLWHTGHLRVEYLAITAILFVIATVTTDTALDTWWPTAVGLDHADRYFATTQTLNLTISAAGPALLGLALTYVPPGALLSVIACLAALSSATLWRAQHTINTTNPATDDAPAADQPADDQPADDTPAAGSTPTTNATATTQTPWQLITRTPTVLLATIASALTNASYAYLYGFEFFLLSRIIELPTTTIGLILSAQAITGATASWAYQRISTPNRHQTLLLGTTTTLAATSIGIWATATDLATHWPWFVATCLIYHMTLSWLRVLNYALTIRLIAEPIRIKVHGIRATIAMALVPISVLGAATCAEHYGFATTTKTWAIIVLLTALGSGALRLVATRTAPQT